jgi:hypothetical protein
MAYREFSLVLAVAVPVILLASSMIKFRTERKWEGWSQTKPVFCGSLGRNDSRDRVLRGFSSRAALKNTVWEGFMGSRCWSCGRSPSKEALIHNGQTITHFM